MGLTEHLRVRAGGTSLAGLDAIRDKAWFALDVGDPPAMLDLSLTEYVIRMANAYLERAGTGTILKTDPLAPGGDAADRAAHWRWLSLRLPADLLVAAAYARDGEIPPADYVSLATSHLGRILEDSPVADTHLHVGAAIGFPLLWTSLMHWLIQGGPSPAELNKNGPVPFGEGQLFRLKLLAAALGRFVLADFLHARMEGHHSGGLVPFIETTLPKWCDEIRYISAPAKCVKQCHRALSELYGKHKELAHRDFTFTQQIYAALARLPAEKPKTLSELLRTDPLWTRLHPPANGACSETLFAARALHYLSGEGVQDQPFADLFWQYQRVRCLTHAYLVQEPGTSGLDWFARHFHRIRILRSPALNSTRYEAAIQHQSVELRLGAAEFRTAPRESWNDIQQQARQLAQASLALGRPETVRRTERTLASKPEIGLVFHFLKSRQAGNPQRLHADPDQNGTGYRFGSWYKSTLREALAIQTAISVSHHPELLLLIRGLDVASSEREIPTWVVAPLMQRIRDESVRTSMALRQRHPDWNVPPLRLTYHAGEEFSRLTDGLRRVHELLETGLLRNGDRIGHGLALGIVPRRWAATARVVLQSLDERLEDLLWELDRYGQGDITPPAGRPERARTEATDLARRMYGTAPELDKLIHARRRRHMLGVLENLGYPDKPHAASEDLLLQYLCAPEVFRRGQHLTEIHVNELEIQFLEAVQQWMCERLARLEITVEANPSSNLLIGDLLGMEDHPVFQFAETWLIPPQADKERTPQGPRSELLVSINSDDPLTFATRLADEYAYLYFALLRRRVPASRALAWLEEIKAHGMRSRFTIQASTIRQNLQTLIGDTQEQAAQSVR